MTKGLPVGLRNLHFTTFLDFRRARSDERVARRPRELDFVICWLDQDGESSARAQLADNSLAGLNEEAHGVGNGTENCDPHRVADNRQ